MASVPTSASGSSIPLNEKVVVTKPTTDGGRSSVAYVSETKPTVTKVEVKKVSGDSNSGKGFFDNPENRKRVKVAAAVVAGVAAIVVGGQAIKKQKEKDDVDPKTGLARAQAEVEETGRNWFGKAKRSAGHTKDAAGHNLNKGKGWVEDKASSAKHTAGDAAGKVKDVAKGAASNVSDAASRFGENQKEAERKFHDKAVAESERQNAALKDAAEFAKSKTGKAYKGGVDAVDDKLHTHRNNVDAKHRDGPGCSIM